MFIYKITNKINEKVYIGQTIGSLNKRFKQHLRHDSCCTKLKNSINKYGSENFIIEEIDGANSLSELRYKEEFWILKYDSINSGYNIYLPSNINNTTKNKTFEEIYGVEKSIQLKKRISQTLKDKNIRPPSRKGCSLSEEHKDKIGDIWRGKKKPKSFSDKLKRSLKISGTSNRKVFCINNKIVYKSMSQAAKELNLTVLGVSRAARGICKKYKGFEFKIYKEK